MVHTGRAFFYLWNCPRQQIIRADSSAEKRWRVNDCSRNVLVRLILLALCASSQAEPVRFKGKSLPVPPSQNLPWAAAKDADLSRETEATRILFDQGMADPRGLEYCAIEVYTRSIREGDDSMVKTHGWVLPEKAATSGRFAVGWNGLVYPVITVGDKAELRADVTEILKAEEIRRAKSKQEWGTEISNWTNTTREADGVSHLSFQAIKVPMLLRLGETELARKVWNARMKAVLPENYDPYLLWADQWVWGMFNRAVCAYARGDDGLALVDLRSLAALMQPVRTAWAKAAGLKPEVKADPDAEDREQPPYFLEQVPLLLADQERRAKQPKRELALVAGLDRFPDKSKRIAALIADLDEVYGPTALGNSTVDALVAQGDDAVEPLLNCMVNDERLTRVVNFSRRHVVQSYEFAGVGRAAFSALTQILQQEDFGDAPIEQLTRRGKEGRTELAETMRKYWLKYKGKSPEERWYAILQDDEAEAQQWLEAARNIAAPLNYAEPENGLKFQGTWIIDPALKPAKPLPLQGDVLRNKNKPSVTELMIRRIESLPNLPANNLAMILAAWDLKAGAPVLKQRFDRTIASGEHDMSTSIVELAQARLAGGEKAALDDYLAWITTRLVAGLNDGDYEPMWSHPNDPHVIETAKKMFMNEKSRWWAVESGSALIGSPMLGLSPFRQQMLVNLTNTDFAGTAKVKNRNEIALEGLGTSVRYPGDRLTPPDGTDVMFRQCDAYAYSLSNVAGMPRCELYWPVAERDKAVAKCRERLKQYGARFEFNVISPHVNPAYFFGQACMTFPALDHSATQADVAAGVAIFTLEGKGKSRICTLPRRPLNARWFTMKEFPQITIRTNKDGSMRHDTDYRQDGYVWQSEELLVNGAWKRFYGFAGPYTLAAIPAEQMEFPSQIGAGELSAGIDCLVTAPGQTDSATEAYVAPTLEKPLKTSLRLANRSGLPMSIPTEILRPGPQISIRSGVQMKLFRDTSDDSGHAPTHDHDWREVKARPLTIFEPTAAAHTVQPGEMLPAVQFDLRDLFDIRQTGDYYIEVWFNGKLSKLAEGKSNQASFEIEAPEK